MTTDLELDDVPVSGGLNAGAELDEEDLFEEPIVAGEVPELKDDLQIFTALESQLQDLAYLQADIAKAHGMNQAFAMEAERIVPGITGVPLGFYTKAPTATRLKVSLEALSKTVWGLIVAATAALIAAIARFTDWFSMGKKPAEAAKDAQEKAKANGQTLHKQEEQTKDLHSMLNSGQASLLDDDGKPVKQISMKSLVDDLWGDEPRYERAKRFLSASNPYFHDILTHGKYTQAFRAITPVLSSVVDILKQKLNTLEHIAAADRDSFLSVQKGLNTRALEAVGRPLEIRFLGGTYTLSEAADRLASIRQETDREVQGHPMVLDEMVSAVAKAYRDSAVEQFFYEQREIVDVFQDLNFVLAKLQKTAGGLAQDGQANHNTEGVAAHLREVIFKVAKDVTGYNQLFAELKVYGTYLEKLANETIGFAGEIEKQLMSLAQRKKIVLPKEWQDRAAKHSQARVDALFARSKSKPV